MTQVIHDITKTQQNIQFDISEIKHDITEDISNTQIQVKQVNETMVKQQLENKKIINDCLTILQKPITFQTISKNFSDSWARTGSVSSHQWIEIVEFRTVIIPVSSGTLFCAFKAHYDCSGAGLDFFLEYFFDNIPYSNNPVGTGYGAGFMRCGDSTQFIEITKMFQIYDTSTHNLRFVISASGGAVGYGISGAKVECTLNW